MTDVDLKKLYETSYMQVYSYVMTLCKESHMAEELTQETFFRAMTAERAAEFHGLAQETTWLCAIAKHLWIDETRKRKRNADLPDDVDSGEDVAQTVADRDASWRLHRLLHELEEPYKEVFSLRVFGELSFAEIGALFGKTETWARVTYHRAKLKIQERMESNGSNL